MATQLHIPAPCHEKWSEMAPIRADCRHCAACDRQIVDFRLRSDAEVLAHLKANDGKICGRFAAGQLDRPLVAKKQLKWSGLTAVAASFTAVLAAQQPNMTVNLETYTATQVIPDSIDIPLDFVNWEPDTTQDSMRIISGRILDPSGAALPLAVIHFANTSYHTYSDSNGDFYLKVPLDTLKSNPLEIVIMASGYMTQIVKNLPKRFLEEDLALKPIDLSLSLPLLDFGYMGGVTIDRRSKLRRSFDRKISRLFR